MNENIDLTNILKNCPEGWKFYSPLFGEVNFQKIHNDDENAIGVTKGVIQASFTKKGFYYADLSDECLLFPSKDQRDWSKFTAPWYNNEKIEKFDPRTLVPFNKILVRDSHIGNWFAAHFSHIAFDLSEYDLDDCGEKLDFIICTTGSADFSYCIPFNDDTKHLVGTTDEAPDFYRYWED